MARMLGAAPTIADTIIEQLSAPFDEASKTKVHGCWPFLECVRVFSRMDSLLAHVDSVLSALGAGLQCRLHQQQKRQESMCNCEYKRSRWP